MSCRAALLLLCVLLVSVALGTGPAVAELAIPPAPTQRINDYARALSAADRERLERKLTERERGRSNQVVVAVFRSLEGASLEDYSIRLAQAWRIGQKGLDNGVILLIFVDDRKMRIEVGYGLEPTLTDATTSSILRDVVASRFREGRLADGIAAGLDAIDQAITGTYQRPAGARPAPRTSPLETYGTVVLWLLIGAALLWIIVPALFTSAASRRHGWTAGPTGWGGPYLGGGWGAGRPGGWGRSSGGGFGGGGGRFGGGGSSGSW